MTVLTKKLRAEINDAAVEHAFQERNTNWDAAAVKVADAIYAQLHGSVEGIVRNLPDEWACYDNMVQFRAEGWRSYRYPGDIHWSVRTEPIGQLAMSERCPWPFGSTAISIDEDHPVYAALEALRIEWHKIHDAKLELRRQLTALLHSVRTTEKLLEEWPAGAQFIPEREKSAKASAVVPHDLAAKINKLMGIGS